MLAGRLSTRIRIQGVAGFDGEVHIYENMKLKGWEWFKRVRLGERQYQHSQRPFFPGLLLSSVNEECEHLVVGNSFHLTYLNVC
jgi:hypothetical protein